MSRSVLFAVALPAIGFAVAWADEPPAAGRSADLLPRISLGLAVEELPNDGPHGGLIIRHVTADGPAAKAGLKPGDILVRVSNRQIDDYDELVNSLAGHKAGDQLTFTVLRGRETKALKLTLAGPARAGARPPEGCRSCAYLGVLTMPIAALSDETAERFGLEDEQGLFVIDVVPGSAAAQAGLRHGDIIRSLDGKELADPDALRTHVHQAGTGKEVKLQVQRGELTRAVRATLTEGPCDVHLVLPRGGRGGDETLERLERRIEALEKRLKESEGKRNPGQ